MRDAASHRRLPGRLTLFVAVVALTLARPFSRSLPGQAADPPRLIAPQERQKLEAQASELNRVGYQAYQQGDLVTAVAMTGESLRLRGRLYPKGKYPQGH